jgi:hypothetical protein
MRIWIARGVRGRGFDATGIDLLDLQVSPGRERFPDADLRVVTQGPLPFADLIFDTVVFKESLHHLAAEMSNLPRWHASVRSG